MTAMTAAAARAAHLLVDDEPRIFDDSLAATVLGDQAEPLIGYHRQHGRHEVLAGARVMVTTRSRYTEDRLAAAIARGVTQYVLLGAGLDTFAWRSPLAAQVRVIEVDQPGTQRWKRDRLASAGLRAGGEVEFAAVDLAGGSLDAALTRAGLDPSRPALVSWLGVIMYLDRDAVTGTLAALSRCAPGTELVAEYLVPDDLQDDQGRTYTRLVAPAAAEQGEPWRTFLSPEDMSALLAEHGFAPLADVSQREVAGRELRDRTDGLRPSSLSRLTLSRLTLSRLGPAGRGPCGRLDR
ncbi:MAG TPA: SAM-dependent methyltransferase [Streptosporangiaceae bacterium]